MVISLRNQKGGGVAIGFVQNFIIVINSNSVVKFYNNKTNLQLTLFEMQSGSKLIISAGNNYTLSYMMMA